MLNRHIVKTLAIGLLVLATPIYAGNVNKSISIESGNESDAQSTVNGSISVGSDATVTGSLKTVNGAIRVGDGSRVKALQTVNGSIKLGSNAVSADITGVNGSIRLGGGAVVEGGVTVVNGRISALEGVRIRGDVSSVNGQLEFKQSEIGGDLTTVNGDILLSDQTLLKGDLVVEKPSGWNWKGQRKPRVVIGPGATVQGQIRLEREVELYIHESAAVGGVSGEMTMAEAVRFSGDQP